jgi:hypothetical protein
MKTTKRFGLSALVLAMSILLASMERGQAEPGPFENFFHKLRHAFSEPQHKSTHRSSRKETGEAQKTTSGASATPSSSAGTNTPPNERNTRTATRVASRKGDDLRYGTPVPGRNGFVTSPFSPDSGYIDVRGFAPGTPVKDPYTGKIFLTP